MKKLLAITAAAAIVTMAGTAMAAPSDTATVTVNANVTGVCRVNSAPTIALTLDPSSAVDAASSGNISLWCTKGAVYTVSDPSPGNTGTYGTDLVGNDAATGNTGDLLPLTLTYTTGGTGLGAGPANWINSNVTATVLNANFITAKAGTYTKQVTMTVSP